MKIRLVVQEGAGTDEIDIVRTIEPTSPSVGFQGELVPGITGIALFELAINSAVAQARAAYVAR